MPDIEIDFTVIKGYGVASGKSKDSPFEKGTIELQKPFFNALGLNLSLMFNGTINGKFDYQSVQLIRSDFQFDNIQWTNGFPAESFQFAHCILNFKDNHYNAFIYQPIKATKIGHLQPENVIEFIAPPITNLHYGDIVTLIISSDYLRIT